MIAATPASAFSFQPRLHKATCQGPGGLRPKGVLAVFPLFLCSSSGGESEGIRTTEESIEGKQHQKPPLEPLPNVHQGTHIFRGMYFPVPIKPLEQRGQGRTSEEP